MKKSSGTKSDQQEKREGESERERGRERDEKSMDSWIDR